MCLGLIKEQDLKCSNRDMSFTKIIGNSTASIGQINSIAQLSKTERILLCGKYNYISTKGLISSSYKNGTLEWTYAMHMECVHIYVDDKESAIYSILFTSGYGLEVHSYNANDTLDRNYMYELEDANIVTIEDAAINGDFNWVLVTMNDNSCYIIMITKIRRKTYKCTGFVSFKGLRFISSDPLVIGNDVAGNIHIARLFSDRFEVTWQKKLTGVTSKAMYLYNSGDSTDTSKALAVFQTGTNNYPMLTVFSYDDASIHSNKILEYSLTNVKISFSSTQADYILSGDISSTNQLVFIRFTSSLTVGDIRVTKANNQGLYTLVPATVVIDSSANIIFGGMSSSNKPFIYLTGEDLSAYSCVLINSERVNINTIEKSTASLKEESTDIALNNDALNALWDNKTGRIFGYDSTFATSDHCIPPLNAHWIKRRYVPNRYAMRFDSV
jgi:hypothetical protein